MKKIYIAKQSEKLLESNKILLGEKEVSYLEGS